MALRTLHSIPPRRERRGILEFFPVRVPVSGPRGANRYRRGTGRATGAPGRPAPAARPDGARTALCGRGRALEARWTASHGCRPPSQSARA